MFEHQSNAPIIPQQWQRTVVLDGRTLATFRNIFALRAMLKPSAFRTIHRAQGCQAPIVMCLFPRGQMSNISVWYTGVSRAQDQCITFASGRTLLTMMEKEQERCFTALPAFLAKAATKVEKLDAMQKQAVSTDAAAFTVSSVMDYEFDEDADYDGAGFDDAMKDLMG